MYYIGIRYVPTISTSVLVQPWTLPYTAIPSYAIPYPPSNSKSLVGTYLVRLETRAEVSEGEESCLTSRTGFSISSRLLALALRLLPAAAPRLPMLAPRLSAIGAAHFHCPIDIGLELLSINQNQNP